MKLGKKEKIPDLPTGFYFAHPAHKEKRFFYLRVALLAGYVEDEDINIFISLKLILSTYRETIFVLFSMFPMEELLFQKMWPATSRYKHIFSKDIRR